MNRYLLLAFCLMSAGQTRCAVLNGFSEDSGSSKQSQPAENNSDLSPGRDNVNSGSVLENISNVIAADAGGAENEAVRNSEGIAGDAPGRTNKTPPADKQGVQPSGRVTSNESRNVTATGENQTHDSANKELNVTGNFQIKLDGHLGSTHKKTLHHGLLHGIRNILRPLGSQINADVNTQVVVNSGNGADWGGSLLRRVHEKKQQLLAHLSPGLCYDYPYPYRSLDLQKVTAHSAISGHY